MPLGWPVHPTGWHWLCQCMPAETRGATVEVNTAQRPEHWPSQCHPRSGALAEPVPPKIRSTGRASATQDPEHWPSQCHPRSGALAEPVPPKIRSTGRASATQDPEHWPSQCHPAEGALAKPVAQGMSLGLPRAARRHLGGIGYGLGGTGYASACQRRAHGALAEPAPPKRSRHRLSAIS